MSSASDIANRGSWATISDMTDGGPAIFTSSEMEKKTPRSPMIFMNALYSLAAKMLNNTLAIVSPCCSPSLDQCRLVEASRGRFQSVIGGCSFRHRV